MLSALVLTSWLGTEHSAGTSIDVFLPSQRFKFGVIWWKVCHEASFCHPKNPKYGSSLALVFIMPLDLPTYLGETTEIKGKVLRNSKESAPTNPVTSFYCHSCLIKLEEGCCVCPHIAYEAMWRNEMTWQRSLKVTW